MRSNYEGTRTFELFFSHLKLTICDLQVNFTNFSLRKQILGIV